MNGEMILTYILGIAFLLAGVAKVAGARPLREQFDEFGLPRWAIRVVGILEVAGAVGLFVPLLSLAASCGLIGLMIGAVANHIKVKHRPSQTAPAFVLLVLTAVLLALKLLNGS